MGAEKEIKYQEDQNKQNQYDQLPHYGGEEEVGEKGLFYPKLVTPSTAEEQPEEDQQPQTTEPTAEEQPEEDQQPQTTKPTAEEQPEEDQQPQTTPSTTLKRLTLEKPEEILERVLRAKSPFKELEKIFPEINPHYCYDELAQLKRKVDMPSLVVACFPTLYRLIRRYEGLGLSPDELVEIGLEGMLNIIKSWNPDTKPTAEEQPEEDQQPIQQQRKADDYLRFRMRRLGYRFRSEIIQRHGMRKRHDSYELIKFYHDSLRRFEQEFGRLPSQNEIIAFMEKRIIERRTSDEVDNTEIGKFFRSKEIAAKISDFYGERNRFPTVRELGLRTNGIVKSFREKVQIIDNSMIDYPIGYLTSDERIDLGKLAGEEVNNLYIMIKPQLKDGEKEVLEGLIQGKTLERIGERLGITPQRVYQIREQIRKKLKI